MVEHRREFHRELEAIEANVIELFGMVAEDLPQATDALLTGNSEIVRTLAERDRAIDDLYPKIEELVDRELVLQAPLASDLRFLVSALPSTAGASATALLRLRWMTATTRWTSCSPA